jgi:two-component system cell cycle response regulator DivK
MKGETAMTLEDAVVLVIEDDENNLLVATDLLMMVGLQHIHTSTSGKEGLALAATLPRLDLILLDIQLPQEDGYAILKRIREHPQLKAVRVAAVTANVMPQDEVRARNAGFDGFIGKPLDFDRFPQQVQSLLSGEDVWRAR